MATVSGIMPRVADSFRTKWFPRFRLTPEEFKRVHEGFKRFAQNNPGTTLSAWAREAFELKMALDERLRDNPVIQDAREQIVAEAARVLTDTVYPGTSPVKRGGTQKR